MNKEARSTIERAISMILKGCPYLQWEFEAICKENAELKEKLEGAEKARDYWKDSSFDWRHKCTSRKPFKAAVKAQKQLTKARKIIKKLYPHVFQGMEFMELNDYNVQKTEVEQFLKEVSE